MEVLRHLQTQKSPYVKHQRDRIYSDKTCALLELRYTILEVQNHENLLYSLLLVNDYHIEESLPNYRHSYPFRKGTGARRWRFEEQKKQFEKKIMTWEIERFK